MAINLLPPKTKQAIMYGRRNRHLWHWAIVLTLSIVGILAITILGRLYIQHSVTALEGQVNQTREQLKIQKLDETQARVETISNNLKLVIQVLSRQILFSELIQQIGASLPADTALTSFQINKVQGGIDLSAVAVDYQSATQIQVNLQDQANKLFDKADILNITCTTPVASTAVNQVPASKYPCQVQVRALFTANNPFLFIKPTAGVKP